MKKERLHIVTIIAGSILAFAIAFSHYFTPDFATSYGKVKTEQSESTDGEESESFISLPAFSLPAPVHVQADPVAYCLFQIFFEKDTDSHQVEEDLQFTDRLLETMFRVIISPNAP